MLAVIDIQLGPQWDVAVINRTIFWDREDPNFTEKSEAVDLVRVLISIDV
jgi:hypothetical protein